MKTARAPQRLQPLHIQVQPADVRDKIIPQAVQIIHESVGLITENPKETPSKAPEEWQHFLHPSSH